MIKINIFSNVWDTDCSHKVDLIDVFNAIGIGRWKDKVLEVRECKDKETQKKLKFMLPCVTFSGTFSNKRKAENLEEYTGLFVADIDKISKKDIPPLKNKLEKDPFVHLFFESPTKGLKVVFKVNSKPEDHKIYAFTAISNYFKRIYDIDIDPSGKDLCRLCFISYDEKIHWRENSETMDCYDSKFSYREWKYQNPDCLKFNKDVKILTNEDRVYKQIKKWLYEKGQKYVKNNRNNYLFIAACNLNRAGVSGDGIERVLTKFHSISPEMYIELQGVIKSVKRSLSHEFNKRPIWEINKRNLMQGSVLTEPQ